MTDWYGNSKNGIEVRYQEDELDEICVYVNGECVLHMEQMSDQCYWMGIEAGGYTVHAHVFSKKGRAHVAANAEGWKDK